MKLAMTATNTNYELDESVLEVFIDATKPPVFWTLVRLIVLF